MQSRFKLDRYFGKDNYTLHRDGSINYRSILNDNVFILRTDRISVIYKGNSITYVLYLSPNRAVYLNYSQLKRVTVKVEDKRKFTYLVKLDKRNFRPYYFKEVFSYSMKGEDNLESLLTEAKYQNKLKERVYL